MQKRQAASIALFRSDEILIIKRAFAPSQGHWTLPGGRLEPGESPEICVRREIAEELDLRFDEVHFVETHELKGFSLHIHAAILTMDDSPRPNEEIADWRWLGSGDPLPEPHTDGLAGVLARARAIVDRG